MHLCNSRKEMVLAPGDEAMTNKSEKEKKKRKKKKKKKKKQKKAKEKQIIINE